MNKIKNFIIGSYLFILFIISVCIYKVESYIKRKKRKSFNKPKNKKQKRLF